MNKTDFIKAVTAKADLSKADGMKAVAAIIQVISKEMRKNGKVAIAGFGSFSVVKKAARTGINPQTKQLLHIPFHRAVKFKAGTNLKKWYNHEQTSN